MHRKWTSEFGQPTIFTTIALAFGALACLLPEYRFLSEDMALADSLTSDGL